MKPNYITHLHLLVDASGSMKKHARNVRNVLETQLDSWSSKADKLGNTVRASIYFFNQEVTCVAYDEDVGRIRNPGRNYHAEGSTALIDATLDVIAEAQKIPEKYGDHAHLLIVLTDGEETDNKGRKDVLRRKLNNLPDNYTVSCLVPNREARYEAEDAGYSSRNIAVWDTDTEEGFKEATRKIHFATDSYLMARSKGIRSTNNLFDLDASKLDTKTVKRDLDELSSKEYEMLPVRKDDYIKPFVENWTGDDYRTGSGYYELMKPETIQTSKNICVVDKITGKVYTGLNARKLVDLPNYEVKVNPNNHGKYKIFVQSTSTNRRLIRGTQLLVLK